MTRLWPASAAFDPPGGRKAAVQPLPRKMGMSQDLRKSWEFRNQKIQIRFIKCCYIWLQIAAINNGKLQPTQQVGCNLTSFWTQKKRNIISHSSRGACLVHVFHHLLEIPTSRLQLLHLGGPKCGSTKGDKKKRAVTSPYIWSFSVVDSGNDSGNPSFYIFLIEKRGFIHVEFIFFARGPLRSFWDTLPPPLGFPNVLRVALHIQIDPVEGLRLFFS